MNESIHDDILICCFCNGGLKLSEAVYITASFKQGDQMLTCHENCIRDHIHPDVGILPDIAQ